MVLLLPITFLKFWFFEAPRGMFAFFGSLNNAFLQLFSLPLLTKTYFKPWKNEYREGLVGFSIAMGIFIKTLVIFADSILFLLVLFVEFLTIVAFVLWPIATLWLLLL